MHSHYKKDVIRSGSAYSFRLHLIQHTSVRKVFGGKIWTFPEKSSYPTHLLRFTLGNSKTYYPSGFSSSSPFPPVPGLEPPPEATLRVIPPGSRHAGTCQHLLELLARSENYLPAVNRIRLHIFLLILTFCIKSRTETAEISQLHREAFIDIHIQRIYQPSSTISPHRAAPYLPWWPRRISLQIPPAQCFQLSHILFRFCLIKTEHSFFTS